MGEKTPNRKLSKSTEMKHTSADIKHICAPSYSIFSVLWKKTEAAFVPDSSRSCRWQLRANLSWQRKTTVQV
jgi:hypothetical protein